jgi:hypothetical protein
MTYRVDTVENITDRVRQCSRSELCEISAVILEILDELDQEYSNSEAEADEYE